MNSSWVSQQFLAAWNVWKPSYIIQERYQVFQTYLGLKRYKQIVHPYKTSPDTLAEEGQNAEQDTQVEDISHLSSLSPWSQSQSQSLSSEPSVITAATFEEVDLQTRLSSRYANPHIYHINSLLTLLKVHSLKVAHHNQSLQADYQIALSVADYVIENLRATRPLVIATDTGKKCTASTRNAFHAGIQRVAQNSRGKNIE